MHRNPVIVCPASTEGVYYALCRTCGAHSPVVTDTKEALVLLECGAQAHACCLQMPLFALATATEKERLWPAAA